MLLLAAILSIILGLFVAIAGEERRVKLSFFIVCLSAAAVSLGIWVEISSETYTFLAARINMTAGLALASTGLLSARVMCGFPINRPVLYLLIAGAVVNTFTVWATDAYFTGEIIRYPWGIYVAGDPKFLLNPLLVAVIALYAVINLIQHYRNAHPLDKNRTKFLLAAYIFLSFGLFDYLPHFGIDLFGGPVSGISTPLFLGAFGYAVLRYRLVAFNTIVGRSAGWVFTGILMLITYFLTLEAAQRWLAQPELRAHWGAAFVASGMGLALIRLLPDLSERILGRRETDFHRSVQSFSDDMMTVIDEGRLQAQVIALCTDVLGSASAGMLSRERFAPTDPVTELASHSPLIETEVVRRRLGIQSSLFDGAEILIPLRRQNILLGAISIGKRTDGTMYTERALEAFHFLGNMLAMALTNTRSALELEKRHQLDRYLAPQVVERVLSGNAALIETKKRILVSVFFSDLKGFTELADRSDPERLSTVLNDYLSEMADIAFRHGGTVDKFIGDAVMVFFGAPVIGEAANQAVQCVRMAIAMHQQTKVLNARWKEQGILDDGLVCRMGIHTGEATVGSFGSHTRLEYTAIGRAVNLASRLEGKCTPGRVLVSQDTWRLLADEFIGESQGAINVKGFADAVEVYEIDPFAQAVKS